ncbi:GmrSD restriction endonuclease domain-containing protein [Helicobacter heilmannii]|uniref:GmrSD restriction endonuclease domain-containing protein n=1 Tax=Helicobacter heilmannii TaxID=35817 RepID=UPI0006B39E8F|nr:DUF262 domain-containing protein [Helicobacter heilmannii]
MPSDVSNNSLCPIKDLEGHTFKIPAYQRGYRWTKKEVQTLLKDIVRFMRKSKLDKDECYSLQPFLQTYKTA